MLGPSHLLFAANAWAAYAVWTGESMTQLALGAVIATAVSDGVLSPDMDQRRPFEVAQETLGPLGRLAGHRQVTHLWWVPALAWWRWLPTLDPSSRWAATALLVGWFSHLLGDFVFGGRKKLPLLLPGWGPRVGLPLRTDGWIETGGRWSGGLSPLRTVLLATLAGLVWVGVQSAA